MNQCNRLCYSRAGNRRIDVPIIKLFSPLIPDLILSRSCRFPLFLLHLNTSSEHPMSCLKYFSPVSHFCTCKYLQFERCFGLRWLLVVLTPGCRSWGSPEVFLGGVWQGILSLRPKFVFPPITVFLSAFLSWWFLSWAWEKLEQGVVCTHASIPLVGGMLCGCEKEVLSHNQALLVENLPCLYFMDLLSYFKTNRQLCEFTCRYLFLHLCCG